MSWIWLLIAGLLEVSWAVGLKYTGEFKRFWPSLFVVVALVGSLVFLSLALRSIPIGTAYAVWVGIGALGAAVLGIYLFQEPASAARLVFLAMLVIAILGLKLTSGHGAQ